MEYKYSKLALALSAALLVGCGSSSSSSGGGDDTDTDTDTDVESSIYMSALINDTASGNTQLIYKEDIATVAQEGTLSVNILLSSTEAKLSYITLQDSSGSNSSAVIDLKMATSNNTDGYTVTEGYVRVFIRNSVADIDTSIEIPGEAWANVELTWSQTTETVEIVVTDFETGSDIGSYSATMNNTTDVAAIRFKNGDSGTGGTTEIPYYVDDILITDASDAEVYYNNFSSSDLSDFSDDNGVVVTDAENADTDIDVDTDETDTEDTDTEETGNLGAQVLDTLTTDTGELRISLSDIATGTLTASVQLQEDENTTVVDDGATSIKSTGYVTLSNGSAEVAEIILSSGAVKYRDYTDSQITIEGLTYTEGDVLDVYVEWDDTEYSISLDGGTTMYGPYVGSAGTTEVDGVDVAGPNPVVDRLSFRLADTSSWSQHELNIDNIVVTDDGTEVLNDSFSSDTYTVADDLLTIYSSSGSEATVQDMDFTDETETEADNYVAQILDTVTDDTGEFRISLTETTAGTLTAKVQLQADTDTTVVDDGVTSIKSTGYVTLSNGSAEVAEIILSSGAVKYRDYTDSQVTIEGLTYTEGDVLEIYIEWDDTEYSISLDGGTTMYGPYVGSAGTTEVDGVDVAGPNPAVDRLSFRLADTSSWSQHEFNVDDIVISEADLSESFSMDTYSVDDDLLTIYSSSGSEATVQAVSFSD